MNFSFLDLVFCLFFDFVFVRPHDSSKNSLFSGKKKKVVISSSIFPALLALKYSH